MRWHCYHHCRADRSVCPGAWPRGSLPWRIVMSYLVQKPLMLDQLLAEVQSPERGGTCVFLGTVRSDDDVTGIEYSAYDDMALAEIKRMLDEAQVRWPDARVALRHRLGLIPVGEASIGIAAAAPHRDEA